MVRCSFTFRPLLPLLFQFVPSGLFGAAGIRASSSHPPATIIHTDPAASSHGVESTTPHSRSQQEEPAQNIESSGSSPEEDERRGRKNWTEEENERLAKPWVNNTTDPVDGNAKKSDFYWKSVTEEFNNNRPADAKKRSSKQCKSHWGTINKATVLFNGVYERMKNTYASGQCDNMLMHKTHEMYKSENEQKLFTMEYLWDLLKDKPKWRRVYVEKIKSKRAKVSESGAYTSSSNPEAEGEDANLNQERRPEGQKAVKAKKGKEKGKPQPSPKKLEHMKLLNDAVATRSSALAATAEAAKEKTRMNKLQTYLDLMEKDTSEFNEARLKQHEQVLDQLQQELFG